jgi:hypothetical protein
MRFALSAITIFVVAVAIPRPAHAIPAFARKYHVPCTTCHVAITRRNEFGELFRLNGYRWPENEATDGATSTTPQSIEMGGNSIFTGLLPESLPVAISLTSAASYVPKTDMAPSSYTLGTPSPNILFGGSLTRHVTFFGTWSGQGAPGELFLVLRRLLDRPEINIRVGQFEQSTTLFKNNESLISHYMLGDSAVTGFAVSQGRVGAEVQGALTAHTFYAVGAVQDGGVGSHIDGYYQISQKFGGIDLHGKQPDVDLDNPSWVDDLVVTVANWGYYGTVTDPTLGDTARIRRLGLDAKVRFRDAELWGGTMYGYDHNNVKMEIQPSFTAFGELSYGVTPWLRPVYLFQFQDSSNFARVHYEHDLGLLLIALENLRVRVKYGYARNDTVSQNAELQLLVAF